MGIDLQVKEVGINELVTIGKYHSLRRITVNTNIISECPPIDADDSWNVCLPNLNSQNREMYLWRICLFCCLLVLMH